MKRRSPFCVPYVVIHILVIITWNHISNQFMREKGDLNALNVMLNFPKNLVWEHILNVCMKVHTLHLVSADKWNDIKAQIISKKYFADIFCITKIGKTWVFDWFYMLIFFSTYKYWGEIEKVRILTNQIVMTKKQNYTN